MPEPRLSHSMNPLSILPVLSETLNGKYKSRNSMIKSLKENKIRINKGKILTRENNIKKPNPIDKDKMLFRVKSAVQSG